MLFLDFEDGIAALEAELAEYRHGGGGEEEARLKARIDRQIDALYARLTPWQTVQVARHPERPAAREIVRALGGGFIALAGDRRGADSRGVVGGIARLRDHGVVLIGHDRDPGDDAAALRKTARMLRLADRFRLPAVLVAGGAYADPDALGACLDAALDLRVPLVAVVSGALAGPGAALPLAADTVLMLEHACLSAATPEEAATAFWPPGGDAARTLAAAAESLGLTARALAAQGLVDAVVAEPAGGAHRHPRAAAGAIAAAVLARLDAARLVEGGLLRAKRRERLAGFGRA